MKSLIPNSVGRFTSNGCSHRTNPVERVLYTAKGSSDKMNEPMTGSNDGNSIELVVGKKKITRYILNPR